MTLTELTQWSTVEPYTEAAPFWLPEEDQQRIAAYTTYEAMYWNVEEVFELIRRDEDGPSLIVPKPKTIVDTTAYYLLKDLTIDVVDPDKNAEFMKFLEDFFKREAFYSRFNTAKHAGVQKGDWLFHITADPSKDGGSRVSLTTLDPAVYFPEYDPDDMETITGVKLVSQWQDEDDPSRYHVKVLRYWIPNKEDPSDSDRRVWREENLWELEDWMDPAKRTLVKRLIEPSPLDSRITQIPVYHFRNAEADGYPFGNSELRGFERVFQGINQAVSDEELALALSGLGVYATDAGRPKNSLGVEEDWVAMPGAVWEVPGATMVKRLEGVTTVTPVQDHLKYLGQVLNEASGTSDVALGVIDAQTAESGVALAIKFIPTLAKIESRDKTGLAILEQMMYDLRFWFWAYEGKNYTEKELNITIGEKLPLNRQKVLEELNNMKDRDVISAKFYRDEAEKKLGYKFPTTIAQDIIDEKLAMAEAMAEVMGTNDEEDDDEQVPGAGGRLEGAGDTLPNDQQNRSNNRSRVNESRGTEIDSDE